MQQGVESLFGSRGSLAKEDAGLARNAAGRVHLAGISQFLQRIEQEHDNAFLRRSARCMRQRGSTNARYLLMGAHLHQYFGSLRKRVMLPILFLLADASWLMTTADAERDGPDAGYLLGASVPMALGWIAGTGLGYELPLKPGGPLASAAALLPAAFVVTLLPTQWRGRRSVLPWGLSAAVALLVSQLIGPNWAMLIGGGLGTATCMVRGDDA